jgi:hypothetical protein
MHKGCELGDCAGEMLAWSLLASMHARVRAPCTREAKAMKQRPRMRKAIQGIARACFWGALELEERTQESESVLMSHV